MEHVARRLAAFIRNDARRDRGSPGTLVRRTTHRGTETLAVYYAARRWEDAARYWESPQPGGYELAVISRRGVLQEIHLLAFRQLGPYELGGSREQLAGAEEYLSFRRERMNGELRWNAARSSIEHRCLRPLPPGQLVGDCGTGLGNDYFEAETMRMGDLATSLIAAARRHAAVP